MVQFKSKSISVSKMLSSRFEACYRKEIAFCIVKNAMLKSPKRGVMPYLGFAYV